MQEYYTKYWKARKRRISIYIYILSGGFKVHVTYLYGMWRYYVSRNRLCGLVVMYVVRDFVFRVLWGGRASYVRAWKLYIYVSKLLVYSVLIKFSAASWFSVELICDERKMWTRVVRASMPTKPNQIFLIWSSKEEVRLGGHKVILKIRPCTMYYVALERIELFYYCTMHCRLRLIGRIWLHCRLRVWIRISTFVPRDVGKRMKNLRTNIYYH